MKAHVGTEGNEAAQEAARLGAENKSNELKIIAKPIPSTQAKRIIDEAIRSGMRPHTTSSQSYFTEERTKTGPNAYLTSPGLLTKLISIITGFNCLI